MHIMSIYSSSDYPKNGFVEMRKFASIVEGYEFILSSPLEITDGFDEVTRLSTEINHFAQKSPGQIPLGHIAFMGDFDQSPIE